MKNKFVMPQFSQKIHPTRISPSGKRYLLLGRKLKSKRIEMMCKARHAAQAAEGTNQTSTSGKNI